MTYSSHRTYTTEEALAVLQRFCAYQERCHQEVYNKLIAMRMIPEAIDSIIVSLINHNYLNESRFAKTFVRGKFRIKKWGRYRLTSELKKRDISKVIINEAISEISEDEYVESFHALAEKKWHSTREINIQRKKKKVADYLLYRGWESHLVYDKIYQLSK